MEIFNRSASTSSSNTVSTSENKRVINSQEYTIENFEESIDNWEIPKIHKNQIYDIDRFRLFKTDYSIKTEERDIQISGPFETIQLLSKQSLEKQKEKKFNYIHIGLVQVGFKPLTKEGLNTSILAVLRDARFTDYEDSLLSSVESSLCSGPISFDCYPNLSISLYDQNILSCLTLQIKTHNYKMLKGSIPVALIYRVYYKFMQSAFGSKFKSHKLTNKGETLFLQTDLTRSNTVIPRSIKWSDIALPEEWILEGTITQEHEYPPSPNTRIKEITQYNDGSVKLSFSRNSRSFRCDDKSNTSTTDLGRVSQIPSTINIHTQQHRYSTSDIPNHVFQNVDYTTRIPKPIYKQINTQEYSPPASPSASAITENLRNELNVIEKDFQINKQYYVKDFYASYNTEKRNWFFSKFLKQKEEIQEKFYKFISTEKIQILFFDWFEIYASQNYIHYPFKNTIAPITKRSKKPMWELEEGTSIESEHPPLRKISYQYGTVGKIELSPFKIVTDDVISNTKKIITQNNYSNAHLNTIGTQLTRIEKYLQAQPVITKIVEDTNDTNIITKKQPIFKPFQISKDSQLQIQNSRNEFIQEIKTRIASLNMESSSSSLNVTPIKQNIKSAVVPDTPENESHINVLGIPTDNTDQESDDDEIHNQLSKIHWKNTPSTSRDVIPATTPDLQLESMPNKFTQPNYKASSLYEWNIDGMVEYRILNLLQQMTMAANSYKTQINSEKAISELLIAGFSGQLKGWWDFHLTQEEKEEILEAIQIDDEGLPIIDELGNPIPDSVSRLILTISLHFIGDPSHLKDKNAELLSNLKCKKLSDLQWYTSTFLTRVYLREDSNQPFWKEKFLAGLPTLLGEKVRNKIKEIHGNPIPYSKFTYGELKSLTQQEGLKICQDLKLQKHLKWELKRTKNELGSFCKQFDISTNPTPCDGTCKTKSSPIGLPPRKPTYRPKHRRYTKPKENIKETKMPQFNNKNQYKPKDITCYKCGRKGHISRYCRISKQIRELHNIEEETLSQIEALLIQDSDTDEDYNEALEIDEIITSSEDEINSKQINVLTQEQKFMIDIIQHIDDPKKQKEYLEKLCKNLSEENLNTPSTSTNSNIPITTPKTYDLTTILRKQEKMKSKAPTIQDLQKEIKIVKQEVKQLQEKQENDSKIIKLLSSKIDQNTKDTQLIENLEIPTDFLCVLREITSRKYMVRITLSFTKTFKIDTIALFDTGADLNCIKEGIVPEKFQLSTKERLSAANNAKLQITNKCEASVINNGLTIRTSYIITPDINHSVILGTPFINLITPYKVDDEGISFKIKGLKNTLSFVEKPKTRHLNVIRAKSVYQNQINVLIKGKQAHLQHLKDDVTLHKINKQLELPLIKQRIQEYLSQIEKEICVDLPNAFWNRKQHIVDLPYEDSFN